MTDVGSFLKPNKQTNRYNCLIIYFVKQLNLHRNNDKSLKYFQNMKHCYNS